MKKIFLVPLAIFSFLFSLDAQITVVMDVPSDAAPCDGEEVCVDVRVKDFSNVTNMQYDIVWDVEVFDFVGVQDFNPEVTGLGPEDFDLTEAANGRISLNWSLVDCNSNNATGITLDDCNGDCLPSIFKVCLRSGSSYGAVSEITIPSTDPVPYVTKDNSRCNNVFLNPVSDILSTCVRPIELYVTETSGEEGDLVCVDVKANGFDDLTSMQFTLEWDDAILDFESVTPNSDEIRSLNLGNFGLPEEANVPDDRLTFSWSFIDGWSVGDGTTLYSVCFRIIGACETSSAVSVIDELPPFSVEVTNTIEEGFVIYTDRTPGSVTVESCDPTGLVVAADCGPPVDPGQEFCVPVTTEGFTAIRQMAFLTRWNPSILEFQGINNINADIPNLDITDFDVSNAANGTIGVDWVTGLPNGASLPGGTGVLYEICFRVVGLGSNSPIQFPRSPARVESRTDGFIGINPTNCEVTVNQPEGLTVTIEDGEARVGEVVCVDFSVNNFTNIDSAFLSPAWDFTKFEFVSVEVGNLPGADISDFNQALTSVGVLSLEYFPDEPASIPDGEAIFTLCLRAIGEPDDCDVITFDNTIGRSEIYTTAAPVPQELTDENYQGGEICTLFPEGFLLQIDTIQGDWLDSVCVDVKVSNFDNILDAAFSLTWDPTSLNFQKIEIPGVLDGLTEASFDLGGADVGSMTINWADSDGAASPLADETVIFRMCFELTGAPDDCYPIQLSTSPEPVVTTENGDGSVLSEDGAICIEDRLIIVAREITPVSCPGATDGTAKLTVIGGREPIGFNWQLETTRFGPEVNNLPAGRIPVTIFDNSRPNSIILRDTIEIPVTDTIPFADAGEDLTFNCIDESIAVPGQGSPKAEGYSVRWRTIGGSLPVTNDQYLLLAQAPGDYILEVTREATGCVIRDTMTVLQPPTPMADAGSDQAITCEQEFATLGGPGTSVGDTVSYRWAPLRGGDIAEGEETTASPRVFSEGTYILTVSYSTNGCSSTDTVVVSDDRVYPDATGGNIYELPCNGTEVVLDGSGSQNTEPVITEWLDIDGNLLSSDLTTTVTETGEYIFRVTSAATSCVSSDTVSVIPPTSFPVVDAGEAPEFSCKSDTVSLLGSVGQVFDYTVQWSALDAAGGVVAGLEDTLATKVLGPGRYELLVTNNRNGCSAADTLEVIDLTTPPMAEAGDSGVLTCNETTYTIDGTASPMGDNYRYSWRLGGVTVAEDVLAFTVDIPGTYYLSVLDTITGCTGVDSVLVENDGSLPTVEIADPGEFDCAAGFLTLNATITPQGEYDIKWTKIDGIGKLVDGLAMPSAVVDGPGSFQITATNRSNGCVGSNVIEVQGDTVKPVVDAGMDLVLTCEADTLTMTGSFTGGGDTLTFNWFGLDGASIIPGSLDGASAQTAVAGTYVFQATNPLNGCFSVDTLRVTENLTEPISEAGDGFTLTCDVNTFELNGEGSSEGGQYTYRWILDGRIIATDTLQYTISSPGTYYLAVRDTLNGCVASDSTIIAIADDLPEVRFLSSIPTITCDADTVVIEPSVFPEDGEYTYVWDSPDGGNIVSGGNTLTPSVDQAGTYRVQVTDLATGCMGENEIIIDVDTLSPMANAGPEMSIDCQTDTVFLMGSGSEGPLYRYQWIAEEGGTIYGSDSTLEIAVGSAGVYTLMVTNLLNGCMDSDEIEVINNANVPEIRITSSGVLDCNNETVTLDATESVVGSNIEATWTPLDGGDPQSGLTITVETPGSYELYIFDNDSGCEARDTVEVIQDQNAPVANAGSDFTISCTGSEIQLDGTGSSEGDTIAYQWTAVSGGGPVTDDRSLMPTVTEAGSYELVVTNTVNGCTASDTITITLENDLPQADAGEDDSSCEDSFTLSATPVTGAQGVWTGPSGVVIDSPSDPTTFVSNLPAGANTFTWTLSTAECPDYSSDEVVINVAGAPLANDDGLTLPASDSTLTVNVLSNDTQVGDVTVTIISQPTQGTVSNAGPNGVFSYKKQAGAAGTDSFTYEICSVECPDLCSTAAVNITIEAAAPNPNMADEDMPMNAITPNGDGRNDALVFDVLLDSPEKFPNNEIIIFNRWGDIVFQASPYINNWQGTNESGQELPDGTYYYILRLDIGEGDIIKGDITILK